MIFSRVVTGGPILDVHHPLAAAEHPALRAAGDEVTNDDPDWLARAAGGALGAVEQLAMATVARDEPLVELRTRERTDGHAQRHPRFGFGQVRTGAHLVMDRELDRVRSLVQPRELGVLPRYRISLAR